MAVLLALGAGAAQAQLTASLASATWTQVNTSTQPSARVFPGMVYDPALGKIVLFGGSMNGNAYNDTWSFDGTTWTQLTPAQSPSARTGMGMVYDSALGEVVLFGGNNANGTLYNDTWAFNGTTWTQLNPSTSPSVRFDMNMVYDSALGKVVLFGGEGSSTLGDTWLFDGSNWTQQNPATNPAPAYLAQIAYDSALGKVVMFSGGGSGSVNTTWTYDGNNWVALSPANSPPAQNGSNTAYDALTGQVVVFGQTTNDLWTFDGVTWTQQNPATTAPPRAFSGMAFDPAIGKVILFGGATNPFFDDTWTLSLNPGSLGYANVCSSGTPAPCSQTATFTFTFSGTGGTIQAPAVLTQGAPNFDFTDAGTGTCTTNGTSYTYTSGATCTVVVNFAPKSPGLRMGAIELLNSSGSVIATSMLSGIGVGPEVTYTPGAVATIANVPAYGVAVDAAGNIYTAAGNNYAGIEDQVVQKVNPATGVITTVAGNGTAGFSGDGGPATSAQFSAPEDVAVDGAGNLYIADQGNGRLRMVTAATGIINSIAVGANFSQPTGVAVDGSGNVYVADSARNRIVKVNPATGSFSVVAGGTSGNGGDGGPATSAQFNYPTGVAVDAYGNIYIAGYYDSRIRKVNAATGIISTVAGVINTNGYSGDGGPATSAQLHTPQSVVVDAAGDLYITDVNNGRVREVTAATGIISTIASSYLPEGIALDGKGNLYVGSYFANNVYEVSASAAPFSFASTTVGSTSAAQTLTVNNIGNASLVFLTPTTGTDPSISGGFSIGSGSTCPQLTSSSGTGTLASGATCTDLIAFSPLGAGANSGTLTTSDNTLNLADSSQTANLSGTGLPPSGTTAQTITFPALPTTEYTASAPLTLTATASSGLAVYYTVTGPATVSGSTLSFTGTAGTVVVTANQGGNNTYKAAAPVSRTITVSAPPSAYTAPTETLNTASPTQTAYVNITTAGTIATVSVLTQGQPNLDYQLVSGGTCTVGASFSAGQVCSVEYTFTPQYPGQRFGAVVLSSSTPSVLGSSYLNGIGNGPLATYTPGTISTVVGDGGSGYNGDGVAATSASLYTPPGLAFDGAGNMYIADCNNNRVRRVSATSGLIATVVGNGNGGYSGDGGPATSAQINCPQNVSLDGAGNLFISDQINSVIREVNAVTGIITTVAGNGNQGYSGDGGPATSATLGQPYGVVPDGAGNLYIADTYNHAVRKVTASTGIITTIAGNGNAGYNGDGIPATSATLYYLTRVAVDPSGNVYIADQFNQRIRKVSAATGLISTVAGNGNGGYSGDGGAAVNAQLNAPTDVALDAAGNLYINEYSNNDVREVTGATQVISTVVGNQNGGFSGDGGSATNAELSIPYGITLDPAGNLYVADLGNNRIRKVTALPAPISFPLTTVGAISSASTLTLNNVGTQPLTFPVPTMGTDPSIATGFSIGSASTCPQLTTNSYSAGTLAAGSNCTDLISFAPTAVGNIGGQIVVTDNTLGVTPSSQTTALSGTAAYATPVISTVSPTSGYTSGGYTVTISGSHFTGASSVLFGSVAGTGVTVVNDSTITVIAPAESAGAVQVTVSNPSYTSNGVSFTYQVPPPVVVSISPGYGAAAGGGTISIAGMNFTGATAVDFGTVAATIKTVTSTLITATIPAGTAATTVDVTVTTPSATSATSIADQYTYSAATAYSAPTEPVGSTSATQTAYVNITTAGTLASISVVTQGVTGADFNAVTGGTCAVGVAYSVGQICSVQYTFAPITPGLRQGAVVLTSSTPTVLGTGYLTGTGTGPLATVAPGKVSLVAGVLGVGGYNGDNIPATSAYLYNSIDIVMDPAGNIFIADYNNNRIRKVTASTGLISTVAGTGTGGYSGDGGPATSAEIQTPWALALDGAGNLYIADFNNQRIREVNAATGIISTVVGNGGRGYSGDNGPATSASLNYPTGVAVDTQNNIYISDNNNNRIRKVTAATGIITTVAGNGTQGYNQDNIAATSAELNSPQGVSVDAAGDIFIADYQNNRVRKVAAGTGIISTVAGNGTSGYLGNGLPATVSQLSGPYRTLVDAAGDLYIADAGGNYFWVVSATSGLMTIVLGDPNYPVECSARTDSYGDGCPATQAFTFQPAGMALDAVGNFYTVEERSSVVRKVTATGAPLSFASTAISATSSDSPQTVTVNNIGNSALTFAVPDTGSNPLISSEFGIGGSSTCPQLTSGSSAATLAAGSSCTDLVSFTPAAVGSTSGSLVTTDNSLNVAGSTQSVSLSGTGTQITQTISFTVASPVTYGVSPITLTATGGASGNPVTFSVLSGPGRISGSTLTVTGAGSILIAANQLGNTDYSAASQATQTLVVNKATPTVTAAMPAAIHYGTASTTLSATVAYTGTLAPTGAVSFIIDSGSAVTAACTGSSSPLTCTANYPTSSLSVGPHTISASVATDSNYGTASGTSTLTVSQATPSITVFAPATFTYGTAQVALTASLSWPGPVQPSGAFTFSIDGAAGIPATCSVGGSCTATYNSAALSAGQHTLSASLASDTNYNAATSTSVVFTVNRAPLTVSIIGDPTKVYDTTTAATLSSANYAVSGLVGTDSVTVTQPAGTYAAATAGPETVTATLTAANFTATSGSLSNYSLPTSASGGGTITKASTTVTWATPAAITYGTALSATQLNATASVGGTFAYTPAAGTVLGAGMQTLNVTFTPSDTTDYSGSTANVTLTVNKATPVLTWATPAAITYGTALSAAQLNATSNLTGGSFAYTPAAGTVLGAGQQTLSVIYTPSDTTDYTTATAHVTLTVNKATPVLSWATPAAITYGTALSAAQLNATSNLTGGSFAYTPGAGTVLHAGSQTLSVLYMPVDTTDYTTAATSVPLTVSALPTVITWPAPAAITYGTALTGTQLDAVAEDPNGNVIQGSYVYAPAPGAVLDAGVQPLSVAFTPTDTTDYVSSVGSTAVQVNPATQTVAFVSTPSTPAAVGNQVKVSATGGASGNPVTFSVLSGPGVISAVGGLSQPGVSSALLTYTGPGTVVLAIDQAGNNDYTAATEVTTSVVVNPVVVPVGQSSTVTTVLTFAQAGTLSSLSYLTQGAPNLDFVAQPVSRGTQPSGNGAPACNASSTYSAGAQCSVTYVFQPTHPGQRLGAIEALDASGNVLGTEFVSGIGTGPQAVFPGNATTNSLVSTGEEPFANLALDGSGDVFYVKTFLHELVGGEPGTVEDYPQHLPSNPTTYQVAVDSAGNVDIALPEGIYQYVAVNGTVTPSSPVQAIGNVPEPTGVAVDASGNIYVSSGNSVIEVLAGPGGIIPANPTVLTLASSFNQPFGLAVDAAGDVYVADSLNQAVKEILAVGGTIPANNPTILTLGGGFGAPAGVAVDAAGDVYVADASGGVVKEIVAVNGSIPATNPTILTLGSGFSHPSQVAVDASGNVYVADGLQHTISKIPLATPPALTFADTNVGQTSTDSPQSFAVANNGYDPTNTDPLTLSSISSGTTSFVIDPASTCSSSSSLEPGVTCSVAVDFTPQTPGTPLTDNVTLADNSLNAESTQTAPLSGNGLQQTPVIAVAAATIDYTTASTPLSATVAYTGTIAPTGAVTFTIDGGSAVTASCTGTTSPLSCSASYPTATLSATTHTITATLAATPGFLTASGTSTLTVNPIAPSITFSVPNHTYGDVAFTLAATSNSSAAFTYSVVSGPASVNGSTLTITGAGAVVVQVSQVAAGNYIAGSQNASFTVAQAVLGASIIGNPTKVYDTTTAATLTPANYALSGVVGTDTISTNQAAGTYASAAAGAEQVTASLASANFTATSGSLSNYILPTSAAGPGTINQASSTTTVSCPASVTYNGAAQTPCTGAVTGIGGLSQSLTVIYTSNVNAGVNTASATATFSGDANHTGSTQTVNFTIAPALLTVSAGSYSGVYDGNTHAISACTVSTNFDSLTCSNNPAQVGPDVGSGTITPVISGPTSNYIVTSTNGTWSITPLAVTAKAGSYSGVYDGNSHAPSACASSYAGVTCTNSPSSVGPGVGSGTVSAVVSYVTGGAADYTLTTSTGSYSITPAPATITPNAATKVYGTADPTLTGVISGFLPADNIVVSYSRNTGQTVAGSPYTISATVVPNPALANYNVTYNTAAFTITPAAASVTPNAATKVYGSADPTLTGTLSGFLPSDGITATYTRTSGETVAGSPYTISATLSPTAPLANYTITNNTAAFTITPAATTTTVSCPASVTYNGAAQTPCTASVTGAGGLTQSLPVTYLTNVNAGVNTASASATYSGDANHTGSTQTVNFTIAPAALTVSAGSYNGIYDGASHAVSGCTASANFDGITCADSPAQVGPDTGNGTVTPVISGPTANYTVTSNNGSWSITARPVTVAAGSYSGVYDGNAHAVSACASSYAGVTCTDSPASVGPGVGSGTVNAVVSYVTGSAADYTVTPTAGSFSITQAQASITPNSATKVYGTSDPLLTGTASGFLPADNIVVSYSRTPGQTVAGSPYTISATISPNPALANYSVVFKTANFTITPATPVLMWSTPAAITYGTALSATQLNATSNLTGGSFVYTPASGTVLGAGQQTLSVVYTPTDTSDYTTAIASVTLTVNQATPVVTWATPPSIVYGTLTGAAQQTASANVHGSFTYTEPSGVLLTVGNYPLGVTFTPTDQADYQSVSAFTTLTVTQATPVVTWANPPSIVYGTPTSVGQQTATATGINGTSLPGSFFYTEPNGTVLTVGQHPLGVAFTPTDSKDYISVSGYATLTVTPATPVIKWTAPAAITYGTPLSATQLNATASVPGTFTYSPAAGTVLGTGAQTLSVIFTPTDSSDYSSANASVALTVNKAQTTTTLAVTTTPTVTGTIATLTATVKPQIGGTPTGTVTFYNGSTPLGTAAVGASFTTGVLPVGTDQITAVYSGDTNFVGSSSSAVAVTSLAPTPIQFTPVLTSLFYPASSVAFTVSVPLKNLQSAGGTVTLYDGTTIIGTYSMSSGGVLVGVTPVLSVGTHTLQIVYGGNAQYPPGESSVVTVTVSAL